ncbi:hypothetical protein rv5_gp149 [Escherichia phage V5]|uniref:Uncharacterized protein n=1 Tax=Escherichia phage V5 TaxID=399183 RepID=B3RGT8_9CAUD|nr:hypothetical protein rv5_gp149 [Escherichia phage V5]ABI79219.1 hypothetical protein [Escherichia phage V5]
MQCRLQVWMKTMYAMCMCRDQVVLYKAYRPNGATEWLVIPTRRI